MRDDVLKKIVVTALLIGIAVWAMLGDVKHGTDLSDKRPIDGLLGQLRR